MKQILLPILAVIVFITLMGFLTQGTQNGKLSLSGKTNSESEVVVNNVKIKVEISKTDDERRKGLSVRESLEEEKGMLFIFTEKNVQPPFWMKDMKFAIDIIWIDDGKIVQIDKNVQPPETNVSDEELILYTVSQPIDYVLEVNAGFAEKNNIEKGDSVDLSLVE